MIASSEKNRGRFPPGVGAWVIVALGGLAFHMAPFLWLHFDDFSNVEVYQTQWASLWHNTKYNRFPLFGLVFYPLLLALQAGLAHAVVVVVHVATSLMVRRALVASGIADRGATLAAALYLMTPAALEATFWLAASTLIFGAGFIAGGAVALLRGRTRLGLVALFLACLFSEGLLIPAGGVAILASRRRGSSYPRALLPGAAVVIAYVLFQLVRRLVSVRGSPLQYAVGVENLGTNLDLLLQMSVGAASSMDAAWYWSHGPHAAVVTRYLPAGWLVLAVGCAAAGCWVWSRFASASGEGGPTDRASTLRVALGCALLALASLLLYLPIVGNSMQSRYAFPTGAFLSLSLGVGAAAFSRQVPAWLRSGGLALLLGGMLFNVWSTGWRNWYPAGEVERRILQDAKQVAVESGAATVYLVNPPAAVGVGYSFIRDWATAPAGRQVIGRDVLLLVDAVWEPERLAPGATWPSHPCVFLKWTDGEATWGTVMDLGQGTWVDCETGEVVAGSGAAASRAHRGQVLLRGDRQNTRQILAKDFPGLSSTR